MSTVVPNLSLSTSFEYTTSGNRIWKIQSHVTAATGNIEATDSSRRMLVGRVKYFPITSQKAHTPEQAEFFISANIGGANPSGGSSTTPVNLSNGSLDMGSK